jgi:hypothetical protein
MHYDREVCCSSRALYSFLRGARFEPLILTLFLVVLPVPPRQVPDLHALLIYGALFKILYSQSPVSNPTLRLCVI